MPLTVRQLILVVIAGVLMLAGGIELSHRPEPRVTDRRITTVTVAPVIPPGEPDPMIAVYAAAQQQTDEALAFFGAFVAWADSIPAAVSGEAGGNRGSNPSGSTNNPGGGGSLTWDQLIALARCESGTDLNDPSNLGGYRTGLFGIEAGYNIGYLSQAEQIAWVQRIYSQYGASAWGCHAAIGG